jgi:hypothetical protein
MSLFSPIGLPRSTSRRRGRRISHSDRCHTSMSVLSHYLSTRTLLPIRRRFFVTDAPGRTMGSYSSKAVRSLATSRPSMHHPGHLSFRVIPVMSRLWRFSTRLQASSCLISNPLQAASLKRRFSRSKSSEYCVLWSLRSGSRCRMEALDPEPILVTKYETTLDTKMEGFERLLGKQKYMAGDVSLVFYPPPRFRDTLLVYSPVTQLINHS